MPVGLYPGANSATGNGVTTSFAYSFRILDEADLVVTVDGVLKVLTTDYTVTGVDAALGGNVVFGVAPANGAAIVIARERAYKRDIDYQRNGSFDEETVDADFDAVVMLIQQVEATARRAFKPPIEVVAEQALTSAMWAARANTLLGFDGAGGFGLFTPADFGAAVVSAFVKTLVDDADADAFMQTMFAGLTVETAPSTQDKVVIQDFSAGEARAMTLTNLFTALSRISNDFYLTNDISPAQLTAQTDNWNPTGAAAASSIRFSTDANRAITGIAGGTDGRILILHNVGSQVAILSDESASSTAANRFALGGDYALLGDHSVALQYDSTTSRWRLFGYQDLPNRAYAEVTTHGNTGSAIPIDDTIPQSGEGTELITVAITPRLASSRIRLRFVGQFFSTVVGASCAATLFKDAGANAIHGHRCDSEDSANYFNTNLSFEMEHAHGGAAGVATTYKVRVGISSGNLYWNGNSGGRLFGGVMRITLIAEEIPV